MERHFGEGTMIENKDKIARLNLPKSQPDVKIMIWETYYGGGGHKGAAGFHCKELPFCKS